MGKHLRSKYLFVLLAFAFMGQLLNGQTHLAPNERDSIIALGQRYLALSDQYYSTDTDSCILMCQLSATAFAAAEDWPNQIIALSGIAGVYFHKGDLLQFANAYDTLAFALAKHKLEGTISQLYVFNQKGILQEAKGDYPGAIEAFEASYNILKKSLDNPNYLGSTILNIATLLRRNGDYDKAIEQYQIVQQLFEKTEPSIRTFKLARVQLAIANCFFEKEDFDLSQLHLSKARHLLSQQQGNEIIEKRKIEVNLLQAALYQENNKYQQAEQLINATLKTQQKQKNFDLEKSYHLLGSLSQTQSQYVQAQTFYERGLQLIQQRFTTSSLHPEKAGFLLSIGSLLLEQLEAEKALEKFNEALQNLTGSNQTSLTSLRADQVLHPKEGVEVLHQIALSYLQLKDFQSALEAYRQTTALIQHMRAGYLSNQSKLFLAQVSLPIYEEAIEVAYTINQESEAQQFALQALQFAEENKAVVLQSMLQDKLVSGAGMVPQSVIERENQLRTDITFYEQQFQAARREGEAAKAKLRRFHDQLFRLKDTRDSLKKVWQIQFPVFFQAKYSQADQLDIHRLQKKLAKNVAVIEYFYGSKHLYRFVLTREKLDLDRVVVTEKLKRDMLDFRRLISQPPNSIDYQKDLVTFTNRATYLREQLLGDLPNRLPSSIKRLTIIPDDILHYIPFEILPTQTVVKPDASFTLDKFPYLIKDYAISYGYSLAIRNQQSNLSSNNTASLQYLGIAPRFAGSYEAMRDCAHSELTNLRCNEAEVLEIQSFYKGQVLTGPAAEIGAFKKLAPSAKIIHLATHACISDDLQGDNRIFFSDGYLTGTTLAGQRLNADLIVLSACNTGSGQLLKGEGVSSLARSITLSGSRSVVMSLWSVDDCSTQTLMSLFYQQLKSGKTKDAAMRLARLAYLEKADVEHCHPFFWAPFVAMGDMQAMASSTWLTNKWSLVLVLALMFVIGVSLISFKKTKDPQFN